MKKIKLALFPLLLVGTILLSGVGVSSWIIYSWSDSGTIENPNNNLETNNNEPFYEFNFNTNGGSFSDGSTNKIVSGKKIKEVLTNSVDVPSKADSYFKGWYYNNIKTKKLERFDFENIDYSTIQKNQRTINLTAQYSNTPFFDNEYCTVTAKALDGSDPLQNLAGNNIYATREKNPQRAINSLSDALKETKEDRELEGTIYYGNTANITSVINLNAYDGYVRRVYPETKDILPYKWDSVHQRYDTGEIIMGKDWLGRPAHVKAERTRYYPAWERNTRFFQPNSNDDNLGNGYHDATIYPSTFAFWENGEKPTKKWDENKDNTHGPRRYDYSRFNRYSNFDIIKQPNQRSYTVKLTTDLNISTNGKINIGGYYGNVGAGQPTSNIFSKYACLDLNGHTLTIDGGTVDCRGGMITNSKSTGGIILKAGNLNTGFVINDFKGGSATVSMYANAITPFTNYTLPFLNCNIRISGTGSLNALPSLNAGGLLNEPQSPISMIGNSTSSLLQYSGSGYIDVLPLDLSKKEVTTEHYKKNLIINNLTTNFNSLKLTLSIHSKLPKVEPDCANVNFPLPCFYDVDFINSSVTIKQRLTMSPGCHISFDETSKLILADVTSGTSANIIGGSITVVDNYDNFAFCDSTGKTKGNDIYFKGDRTSTPAKLILNGTIETTGSVKKFIGGNIVMSQKAKDSLAKCQNLVYHSKSAYYTFKTTGQLTTPIRQSVQTLPIYSNEPGNTYCYFDKNNTNIMEESYMYDVTSGSIINKSNKTSGLMYKLNKPNSIMDTFEKPAGFSGIITGGAQLLEYLKRPNSSQISGLAVELEGTFVDCVLNYIENTSIIKSKTIGATNYVNLCGVEISGLASNSQNTITTLGTEVNCLNSGPNTKNGYLLTQIDWKSDKNIWFPTSKDK